MELASRIFDLDHSTALLSASTGLWL